MEPCEANGGPSSSQGGMDSNGLAQLPRPVRQALGWLAIAVSPVFCAPFVAMVQNWERLGESNTPLWVLPIVMVCYAALTAAFLCVGSGFLRSRPKLLMSGCFVFAGAFTMLLTLFGLFD